MRRTLRLARRLVAVLLILVLLAAGGAGIALWSTLPPSEQTLDIPGLSGPVEIGFDRLGIPRIQAANETDAATALGFVHARDRMFQMEMMRRAASGRLAALLGPKALPVDRMMRTLGLARAVARDYAGLEPETKAMLEAYARGVNAWIALCGRRAAPEFLLLGAPEPWRPQDSLLWAKTMDLWLSANWRTELSRLSLAGKLPPAMIDELWPAQGEAGRPDAALPVRFAAAARRLLGVLPAFPQPFTGAPTASDEWAVDATRSATGAPLLAGDPHLGFGFPGIWYLARIEIPGHVLAGATAPGVPFLVIGHNERVAWTFTSTGADTQDVFIETPLPDGMYATPDGPRPFTVHKEWIRVRGGPNQILRVRETRHGPVISDLDPAPGGEVLAVSMAGLAPGDRAADGLFALNRATNLAEVAKAAGEITSPVQNLLAADRTGIGLFVTGRVPIRRAGDGSAPVPGADGAHDWTGFASGAALPRYVNPPSGQLVNGNERIAPPDFPVFMGRDWYGDWRARRIRALLDAPGKRSLDDFAAMQTDAVSGLAVQLLPRLQALAVPPGPLAETLALLRGWDGTMAANLPQPLIFTAWMTRFRELVLARNHVPADTVLPKSEFTAFVLSPAGAHWCGGNCDALLRQALGDSRAALAARFGDNPAGWRWDAAHRAVFAHPVLRGLPLLGWLTTLAIPAPGDDTTLFRGIPAPGDFTDIQGPGYRGVYDLSSLDASRFMAVPGQSGNPLSRHAGDLLALWRDGATILLGPDMSRTSATIRLNP
jgi:penicillin amidase